MGEVVAICCRKIHTLSYTKSFHTGIIGAEEMALVNLSVPFFVSLIESDEK